MSVTVRFAPSPTGRLHLGNARTALINWLFARRENGRFVLRLDDTDRERSTASYAQGILDDLRWLGLEWDQLVRQSDRLDRYAAAADRLRAAGRLYPCFETAEELETKRRLAQARGRGYAYDRAALALSAEDVAARIAAGAQPHWRFKLEHVAVAWTDLVRGPVHFEGAHLSDPVLVRADGMPLYTLSSVVDDVELGISHVIRGEDHVANTAVQIQIFAALGAGVPQFAHLALIADASGSMLSKRLGSLSLAALAAEGFEPMAINSLLAKLGTADAIEARTSLAELVAEFDLGRFGRAQPKLDAHELETLNAKLLHRLPFDAVRARLPAGADAAFWDAVRPNLLKLAEAEVWWQVCGGDVAPRREDPAFLETAARLLPEDEPFDAGTWTRWTRRLREETGRTGRGLFQPLRLALTGREHGPELQNLLPLIGRERALRRLRGDSA